MLIKKNYLDKNTRKDALETIYDSIILKKNAPKFDISSSALIVTDMQNYFLNKNSHAFVPSSLEIIENINNLIGYFNKMGRPVILTKHINNKDNAKLMGTWWNEIIENSNELSEISNLINSSKSIILIKTQYDAFYNTNLAEILEKYNVNQVVITGLMTHLCCETTARSAFVRGYLPVMPVDATATYNLDLHCASLSNLSHGFCITPLTSEIINDHY